MLPVLYIRYLGIVVCELGIRDKVADAITVAIYIAAAHGCPHRAVVEQLGKLGVAREHVEYFAIVVFNINGLRYGRNLNKYVVTVVAIAVAAVAELLAAKLSGQLKRAVILLYGMSRP